MDEEDFEALTEHLKSQGCDEQEILQILNRVREFDRQMIHQSVFDSIATSSFNIDAVIDEVRAKDGNVDGKEGDSNVVES